MNPNNAAKLTLAYGLALIALAIIFVILTQQPTALIPVGIGLPAAILGFIAFKDNLRKHAVHFTLVFALLGLLAALGMIPRMVSGEAPLLAAIEISLMGLLSAAYLALAIKSFINARKAKA